MNPGCDEEQVLLLGESDPLTSLAGRRPDQGGSPVAATSPNPLGLQRDFGRVECDGTKPRNLRVASLVHREGNWSAFPFRAPA